MTPRRRCNKCHGNTVIVALYKPRCVSKGQLSDVCVRCDKGKFEFVKRERLKYVHSHDPLPEV